MILKLQSHISWPMILLSFFHWLGSVYDRSSTTLGADVTEFLSRVGKDSFSPFLLIRGIICNIKRNGSSYTHIGIFHWGRPYFWRKVNNKSRVPRMAIEFEYLSAHKLASKWNMLKGIINALLSNTVQNLFPGWLPTDSHKNACLSSFILKY